MKLNFKVRFRLTDLCYHIVCMIIFMNIIQFGVLAFGINFNMLYVEYFLLSILVIIKKVKIKSKPNLLLLYVTILVFIISLIFHNNSVVNKYIIEYIIYALPLVIIFMFKYNYKRLSEFFYKYAIICSIIYLINIFIKSELLNDYMTIGYAGMFSVAYIVSYSIVKKKYVNFLIFLVIGIIIFVHGSRGSILILLSCIIMYLLFNINDYKKRIMLFVFSFLIIFNMNNIIDTCVDTLTSTFGNNLYSINQIVNMLEKSTANEMLDTRYYIYQNGIYEIKENTIFGLGIGGFEDKYGYFVHNIFLDVFTTFGMFLGTAYFIFLVIITQKVYRIAKNNRDILIFFIFCISISLKLLFSKVYIYDSYIWLMITLFCNIFSNRKELEI